MARILVADADPDEGALIAFALRFAGHTLQLASDPQSLYQKAYEFHPDLFLVDYRLTRVKGPSLLQFLRSKQPAGDPPVVFIVGSAGEANGNAGLPAAGAIRRPIDVDALTRQVNAILKQAGRSLPGRG